MIEQLKSDYISELERNGMLVFVPGGNSMWPTIKNRRQTVIVIKKQAGERLKEYDMGLFVRKDNKCVLHRVMELKDDGYIFLGDSCMDTEFVVEDAVLGVVTGFYKGKKLIEVTNPRYIKKVKRWFKRKRLRKVILKLFFITVRIKRRLKRLFRKGEED